MLFGYRFRFRKWLDPCLTDLLLLLLWWLSLLLLLLLFDFFLLSLNLLCSLGDLRVGNITVGSYYCIYRCNVDCCCCGLLLRWLLLRELGLLLWRRLLSLSGRSSGDSSSSYGCGCCVCRNLLRQYLPSGYRAARRKGAAATIISASTINWCRCCLLFHNLYKRN